MKVAIYTRVGKIESEEEMKKQKTILKEYAQNNGYEVIKVLSEYGSSNNMDRSKLKELLELPSCKLDAVLVTNIDRISRNMSSFLSFIGKLDASGKKLITTSGSIFPDDNDKMLKSVLFGNGGYSE